MNDKELIEKLKLIHDDGDGILPCSWDCDANKVRDLLVEYFEQGADKTSPAQKGKEAIRRLRER